ncbi:MAG: ATP-binding cassette domain-containing protein [Thermoplasmatales archaeon]|nr:ATP-binding cassette domain-containing protein [Thermoplasmatales archaeon]
MTQIMAWGLTKKYGDNLAVDSLDLSVGKEIYGLLGPNGSGKTTTVGMLTTLVRPASGTATVCGHDILTDSVGVRRSMSYVPQDMAVDIRLTGRENVDLMAKLYGIHNKSVRKRRVDEAIGAMGLTDRADEATNRYSGGMRRRLELAQAFVHDPEVLFLDEPTVGLDVASRRSIWEYIKNMRGGGITVFVNTHHMDEAERYCDRVGILKRGVLTKEGTPRELVAELDDVITVRYTGVLPGTLPDGIVFIETDGENAMFSTPEGGADMETLVAHLKSEGVDVISSSVRQPTLEDAYVQSVGPGSDGGSFNTRQFRNVMMRR